MPPPPDFSIKPAAWVAGTCSGGGMNCNETQCCREMGAQCYVKAPGWAACKAECVQGPDPTDIDSHPWDCKELGMRTPGPPSTSLGAPQPWVLKNCSDDDFDQCLNTRCCKQPGRQCFRKNATFASCLDHCTPGPQLTSSEPGIWNCTPLGGRTPGVPQLKHKPLAPWVDTKCSKASENCMSTMCCAEPSMQCYSKTKTRAECSKNCDPGDWLCEKLGPRTPRPWGSPSLYCLSVIMLSTYEAGIMRQALRNGGIGIFACDLYDVFSQDGETVLGDGPNGEVRTHHFTPAPVTRSVDGTAGNAMLFENVWEAVKWVGAYALTDYTVKSDPDAVVLPTRLRDHLRPHVGFANYIVNCNKPYMHAPMMFGSVEAMSKQAMDKYFFSGATCHQNYQFGEDRWLGDCFQMLGVQGVYDFNMVGDNVCTGANCGDGRAAYHPFKSEAAWMACYNIAMR